MVKNIKETLVLLQLPEGFSHLHNIETSPLGIISIDYDDEQGVSHDSVQLNVECPLLFRGISKTSQWGGIMFQRNGEAYLYFTPSDKSELTSKVAVDEITSNDTQEPLDDSSGEKKV